ncbi:CHAT domain-containing protein [Bradyrhizobium japonicum]|uniref:CHAT domain-containing protein n=1 Tax=Bradyrhizobium japonicum TaxID=375 RepID=UPI00200D8CB8|nr:CHAT domain-containing protein [Bradyrhizobium japonicum]UQD98222.1 CHAT domain-containing protein [Bradyrhizobium japonicum]
MRTITLELVRHGPAHNQLLSPLTQYLALCENHPAVTLQLQLEHNQMLYRLSALAYRMGKEPREFQLRDTAQLVGDLLARIPGLTADMNRREDLPVGVSGQNVGGDRVTHLRLVLSASELALLPFELAVAPIGFPGAGQSLLLQSVHPVSITRETRRVAEEQVVWPERARVLFVVASPPEVPAPPAAAHLLALRRTLEPWVGTRSRPGDGATSDPENDRLAQHLTVLTEASLEAIEAACSEGKYTHVHILAHGGEYADGYDTRFGLLLHDSAHPMGPADRVSGERLATALRTSRKGAPGQLARPAVVTLASCYSGAVGSITGVGASIAHALHADGIPMVIASQFPLSFGGSVRMVEMLYEGLLSGEDPRRLLIDLRRSLHTQFPDTHDWASITAYSSLPPNFDRQLAAVQIQRARLTIEVALGLADEVVARVERSDRRSRKVTATQDRSTAAALGATEIKSAMNRVREARARLARLVDRLPSERARIVALLASADKREAALEYETLKRSSSTVPMTELDKRVWPPLERARKLYDNAFGFNAAAYWAVVQYISLSVVMRHGGRLTQDADAPNEEIGKLWALAEVQSLRELSSLDYERRAWALGNLIELYILAPVMNEVVQARANPGPPPDWRALATQYAKDLAKMAQPGTFEVFSTRRQIVRYLDLYAELCPSGALEAAVAIAEEVVRLLPAQLPEDVPER